MHRLVAGVLDPGSPAGGSPTAEALDEASWQVAAEGMLTVAWTGDRAQPARRSSEPLCMLDGRIENIELLARDLDVAPAAPEEILAAAWYRLGERVLPRLRGRFAMLVWDSVARRGVLAADQLGSRPLYYASTGRRLVFASDLVHLNRLLPSRPPPDRVGLVHWLASGRLAPERTLYEGVHRLPGGHLLELDPGGCRMVRYWEPRYAPRSRVAREEAQGELRTAIAAAVRRGSADADPLGVLLSGGLDSGTVAAVAKRLVEPSIAMRSYSALFPGHPAADESAVVERATSELDIPSTRLLFRPGSMLAASLEFLQAWSVPSISPNLWFGLPLLREAAAEGVSVVLDGEGGDELFGHAPYLLADRLLRGRLLSLIGLTRSFPGLGPRPPWRSAWWLLRERGLMGAVPVAVHRAARRVRPSSTYSPRWLTDESAHLYAETSNPWAWKSTTGPRWWRSRAEQLTTGRERFGSHDLLRRQASLAGVDLRHPFMDDLDLIELMLRLPPELAFSALLDRPLLRASMAGIVPDSVRLRPDKTDFSGFFRVCLRGFDWDVITSLLGARDAALRAYVRGNAIERLLETPPETFGGAQGWQTWRFLGAECWLRTQEDGSFPRRLLETAGLEPVRYTVVRA